MPTKDHTIWLVVNWRNGDHRSRKQKPKKGELGTNELLAKINLEIDVPDVDVPTLAAKIDVPEPRVHAATIDALDKDDLPDWTSHATDAIEAEDVAIQHADGPDVKRVVDSIVTETLIDAPGRPDPELVREYVWDVVDQLRHDDVDSLDDVAPPGESGS